MGSNTINVCNYKNEEFIGFSTVLMIDENHEIGNHTWFMKIYFKRLLFTLELHQ